MLKIVLVALTALTATTSLASASGKYNPDRKAAAQAREIEQGRQEGSITWTEGLKLRAEQRRIARLEQAYKADGRLDYNERQNLKRLQAKAGAHIERQSEDRWTRWSVLPRIAR